MSEISTKEFKKQSISYRMGYVEGQTGERNIYLLEAGVKDIEEYNRGFKDGAESRNE